MTLRFSAELIFVVNVIKKHTFDCLFRAEFPKKNDIFSFWAVVKFYLKVCYFAIFG